MFHLFGIVSVCLLSFCLGFLLLFSFVVVLLLLLLLLLLLFLFYLGPILNVKKRTTLLLKLEAVLNCLE